MPNSLLQTKTQPPQMRPGFVQRPRLTQILDGIDAVKLLLLSAPAGFGKTTLLSGWINDLRPAAAQGPQIENPKSRTVNQVAWLSLDEGDNDVARFFAYWAAAIKTIQPEIGSGLEAMLQAAQLPAPQTLLTYLLNEIGKLTGDVILVLDDYHSITEPAIHEAVQFMLDYLPAQLHLVIATRADPPLGLARLRSRGEMLEIRAEGLRFHQDEAASLLNQTGPEPLDAADVLVLEDKTEGWAAGLQLAALALRGQAEPGAFIQTFKGNHRFILGFLVDEVLEQQPQTLLDFLLATSVLERLSVPLCDAVSGRQDSRAILDRLIEANLFVISLDDSQSWYRYHRLFRDALRHRLEQQSPAMVAELHRRAQRWYAAQGFIDEALYHAFATNDIESAAELITRHARPLLNQGAVHTLHRWISRLPQAAVRTQPSLVTTMAWIMVIQGQLGEVERYIDILANLQPQAPELQGELDALRALIALNHDRIQESIRLSERSQQTISTNQTYIHSLINFNLGLAYRFGGNVAASAQAYEAAIRLAKACGNSLTTLYALTNLAALREANGELQLAQQTYQQILAETSPAEGQPLPLAGLGYVGLGKILREWNRLDEAEAQLHVALRLGKSAALDGVVVDGLITLGLVHMGQRAWHSALDALQQAHQIVLRWQQPATLLRIQTFAARVRLLSGDLLAAERWRWESGVTVADAPTDPQAVEQTMLARVLVAQGEFDPALSYIERLQAAARREHRVTQRIELYNLQALALARSGDRDAALASLKRALTLAQPGGYRRIFLDEDDELTALLARFASGESSLAPYARQLSAAAAGPDRARTTAPALIEQLSDRELEVLGLVAKGLTNQEIAARLVIAKGTVKKHIENIFGKLHVANRTQAVTRARELRLL